MLNQMDAVDAAVAAGFTLSVVRPESCGLGGGGFMVIYLPDDPTHGLVKQALNFRETAPAASRFDMFERSKLPDASTRSGLAVAVPGTVAGLLEALDTYGTLDRATVLQPAIDAAVGGFVADSTFVEAARHAAEKCPAEQRRAGDPFWDRMLGEGKIKVGQRVRNLDQAAVLADIAAHGRDGFDRGRAGAHLVEAARKAGGILTLEDVQDYAPVWSEPIEFAYGTNTFLTMPLPSSGGVVFAETLGIFHLASNYRGVNLAQGMGWDGLAWHVYIESLKHAFADRSRWLADPRYVDVPVNMFMSDMYAHKRAGRIEAGQTLPSEDYGTRPAINGSELPDDSGTSHLSVVDQWGGAVACTQTINLSFGAQIVPTGCGFCLNNEMDDFTTVRDQANAFGLVQSDRNLPEPGKWPLSSMSPTIVLAGPMGNPDASNHRRVVAVAGASGGPRIITGTMEVLMHVLVDGMNAADAVAAPRLHHQWLPNVVKLEPGLREGGGQAGSMHQDEQAGAARLRKALRERGHTLGKINEVGVVQLIVREKEGGLHAACDPRKGGKPAGH